MADIQLYENDCESGSDPDGYSEGSDDYESECMASDAELSALQRMLKYLNSEHSYNRQMVVRDIVNTLQQVLDSRLDVERVFSAIAQLSNDSDDRIRCEMIEHIPMIAEFTRNNNLYSDLDFVSEHLFPIIMQYLSDRNTQVRKAGHSSLLQMLNYKLITNDDVEQFILPRVESLADPESVDDLRTDAVTLMSRMAPLVGKELTERVFLNRFAQLCNDALFHVRKVCALHFGEMCQVVGQQSTETCLLPKFYYLCEDGVWGVRNACAECFNQVSRVCSSQVRHDELTPLFISLLCDQSRWVIVTFDQTRHKVGKVRLAAFHALGGFISTFADSRLTGLELTQDGRVVYKDPNDNSIILLGGIVDMDTNEDDAAVLPSAIEQVSVDEVRAQIYSSRDETKTDHSFDSFNFWRVAPPVVDPTLLLAIIGDDAVSSSVSSESVSPASVNAPETLQSHYHNEKTIQSLVDSCQLNASDLDMTENNSSSINTQTIVPSELLGHYMSMIEPARAQTVDPEIMRQCAFSFPAVALTLGRSNWHCIRDLYKTLAKDMQWKVRRTLAFSIHQLAAILGEELTMSDLVPVFDDFVKDLDEVRIGVLKHFANFLKILNADIRNSYLTKLPEFLKIDNSRNWRFRLELAGQLPLLVELFSGVDVYNHIRPIALSLSEDHVAEIRVASVRVISAILGRLTMDTSLGLEFVEELKCKFGNHKKSSHRQLFLLACCYVLEDKAVGDELFAVHLLPAALARHSDSVPNTRIALARLLDRHILTSSVLSDQLAGHYVQLMSVVDKLKNDPDRDVRYILTNSRTV